MILQILLPYILLLYVVECVTLVKHGSMVFEAFIGGKFRARKSGIPIKALGPEFLLVGILPVAKTIVTEPSSWIFNKTHFGVRRKGKPEWMVMPYGQMESVENHGAVIFINKEQVWEAATVQDAQSKIKLINKLKKAKEKSREKHIKHYLFQSMNLLDLRERLQFLALPMEWLTSICLTLFCIIFFMIPVLLYRPLPTPIPMLILLASTGMFYLAALVFTYILHRKMYPQDKYDRFVTMASLMLCPPGAMHALQYLTRKQFAGFDSLAVAGLLLDKNAFMKIVRENYLFTYKEELPEDFYDFTLWRNEAFQNFTEELGLTPEDFNALPCPASPDAVSYCPKCLTQYAEGVKMCADCQLPLTHFAPTESISRQQ